MRLFIGFLTCLLIVTACAAPVQRTTVPVETTAPESHVVTLDGTFQTSLLAVVLKSSPRDSLLLPINPLTGATLPGYEPISLGETFFHTFSPDRQTLAVVSYDSTSTYDGSLLFIDLPSWKTRRFELHLAGWVSAMTFSPDEKRLAIALGEFDRQLTILNVEDGSITAESKSDVLIQRLKFTQNGEALMLYGQSIGNQPKADPPQVRLLDVKDLSPLWSAGLEEVHDGLLPKDDTITQLQLYEPGNSFYLYPGLDFAPDKDTLYIAHADSEKLTTVDFRAHTVKTVEVQPKLSLLEQILSLGTSVAHAKGEGTSKQAIVSPDGQFLYVVGIKDADIKDQQGNFQLEHMPLGLEMIQTSDGSRVERVKTDTMELSISPDGHFLYLRNWADTDPWSEIFDITNRKIIARKEKFYATPAFLMNGEFLLTSTYIDEDKSPAQEQYHMNILQPSDLSVVADWTGSEFISWLTP